MTIMVLVDDREPKKVIKKGYKYFPDLTVTRLDVGDVVDGNVAIERKAILDFVGSVNDNRIFFQCQNMKMNYEHSYVIMVGSYEDIRLNRYVNFSVNRFIGAMADLTMLYKVPVLRVENDQMFWRYCQSLFKKANGKPPQKIRKGTPKADIRTGILCGVPGLGEKRAKNVLGQFTIHELCHATVKDIQSVDGIGIKRARAIKEAFK
jgi:ERCC4-type nuclease